ncbi:MAG: hypothetical protein LQ345_005005 [Seirophora villosa]|nr:MAG: hypothetical protein LQ345_005005 [Seirophora villosa]
MASHGARLPVEKLVDSENSSPHADSDSTKASHETNDCSVPYSVFSQSTRRWTVLLVALAGFFSPLSANIYFPALNYLAHDLNVSLKLINLTITAYLIFQGIVPFIVGDAADKMGRRPVYIAAFIVYLGANIGLALQNSYPALLVLRILQSSGSSGTIALAISVVADLAPPHERGKYMGAALCGPNTAPSLGPVLGGVLAEKASWRWIFWFLSILSGLCLTLIIFWLPETARRLVGNGSILPGGINKSPLPCKVRPNANRTTARPFKARFRPPNPISCLRIVFEKDTALVLVANAIFYVNYSCLQASLSPLMMDLYRLNALQAGLTYLPYGIACGVTSILFGKLSQCYHTIPLILDTDGNSGRIMDRDYRMTAAAVGFTIDKTNGDDLTRFPIEKARLRSIWYYVTVSITCTVGYGWTLETRTHLAAPLVLQFICGIAVTCTFNIAQQRQARHRIAKMNSAMRSQYHNLHHQNAPTPPTRRGGIAPIVPNPQAQREAQLKELERREAREKEMAQRRTNRPTDKNLPDGIDEFVIGDGVQQYKRLRDVERRLDAMMMRKRLDLQDPRHHGSKRYKKMRIWISNTVDFQQWQKGEEQELYDFSGHSEGTYRMKIEGRLLEDKDDTLSDDDDSDAEHEGKVEAPTDNNEKPVVQIGLQPKTKLSHFFKAITVEFDRNKNLQADYTTQVEWKRPSFSPNAAVYPEGADFDSLEFERKGDSDMNCTVHFYRDDDRYLLSDPLAELLDCKEADRNFIMIGIWDYVKAMNLQQDDEKRAVQCDDRLRKIFNRDVIYIPQLDSLLTQHHLFPLPPISLSYTIRCEPSFHTSATEPPIPTIYDLTLLVKTPSYVPPLSYDRLRPLAEYDAQLAHVVQAIQHSKSKHAFMTEFEKDPVGFLKRWMGSQRRDLEVIVGDGVGMGRGEGGVGDGYGVGPEWRRGGERGVWGRDEVRESVKLMRDRG